MSAAAIESDPVKELSASLPQFEHRVRFDPKDGFPGLLAEALCDVWQTGNRQFNFFSGGRKSGLSTIAWCAATRSQTHGAVFGKKVALFVPDKKGFEAERDRIILDLEPATAKVSGNEVHLKQREGSHRPGGKLIFGSFEEGRFDLTERVDFIVIDGANRVPGFYELWHEQILPLARKWKARVYVFGRASAANTGFGRLCLEYAEAKDGRHVEVPSRLNPWWKPEDLERMRSACNEAQWQQDYEGKIVEGASIELSQKQMIIADDETFLAWCDRLAADGLEVDGKPFKLDDRPAMRWIYEQIPSTQDEAFGKRIVLMKCSQVGFTVMEMLAMIYMALKFMPTKVGMFLPQQQLATIKSSQRFMPIVRTVPDAHKLMLDNPSGTKGGEGNVLTRNMGKSIFYFLWTTGKATTESIPMDVLSFDEVQEMSIADMEKTQERLSASQIRFTLMGSTANWPDADIHFFYKQGTQHRFWTHCSNCGHDQILDEHFPNCVKLRPGVDVINGEPVERTDYRYVCVQCDGVIPDSQAGEWRPENPEAFEKNILSIHFPQLLSPTISPRELIESFHSAASMKNFYNRKLGRPYTDPSQVPVTLEILNECARIGMELGVKWEDRGAHYFMGLDQGGLFNVAIIAKRLPSGHMAVVHVEECYGDDPFLRCSELMHLYGIDVCVVESLPNYNDAKRFAGRHPGKVFLASYTQMKDEMIRWGDSVPTARERKTDEEDRDRYTVTLDQYKCMDVATSRITKHICVFPDPDGLVQSLKIKERSTIEELMPILRDRVFLHLTRVALVAEQKDDDTRTWVRVVKKIGIDPHFAYAFMLLNVAWARSHGTTMFLNPDALQTASPTAVQQQVASAMPGLPQGVVNMLSLPEGTCGRCVSFQEGLCTERNFRVGVRDPGCDFFIEKEGD